MAIITLDADSISNESDLLDLLHDELVDNRGWTSRRNEMTGTNNREIWVEKDKDDTVSDRNIIAGFRSLNTNAASPITSQSMYLRLVDGATEWTDSENAGSAEDADFNDIGDLPPTNTFLRAWGFHPYRDDVTNAWVIVPDSNDSGEQYFYCVVQFSNEYYFYLGAGEIEKAYDFTGGEFVAGSSVPATFSGSSVEEGFLAPVGSSSSTQSGLLYCDNGSGTEGRVMGTHVDGVRCPFNYFSLQIVHRDLNPSTDSGQFIPFPIAYFAGLNDVTNDSTQEFEYIGAAPQIFLTNIKNLNDATEIVIGTNQYLVTPLYAREGAANGDSFYMGLLIRTQDAP